MIPINVTPGTFEFFGMPALYGRVLQPADYQPGAPPVFVMRHKTWMERFNGDPGVLNKTFVLNGTARASLRRPSLLDLVVPAALRISP
jgi:hypothetical protein